MLFPFKRQMYMSLRLPKPVGSYCGKYSPRVVVEAQGPHTIVFLRKLSQLAASNVLHPFRPAVTLNRPQVESRTCGNVWVEH